MKENKSLFTDFYEITMGGLDESIEYIKNFQMLDEDIDYLRSLKTFIKCITNKN